MAILVSEIRRTTTLSCYQKIFKPVKCIECQIFITKLKLHLGFMEFWPYSLDLICRDHRGLKCRDYMAAAALTCYEEMLLKNENHVLKTLFMDFICI